MKACVFVGPTLRAHELPSDDDVVVLPPVAQGDVYRVALPKGRKLTVTVTSDDDVRIALFSSAARTVESTRNRLAVADRAGKVAETVTYTNRGRGLMVLFLDVSPGRARTVANPSYRVDFKTAKAAPVPR